ncbi:chromosome partitioning protein [Bathymodiolus japonicus methanotrophic gill symbiont]|uniref:ParA family protein n=1 Tax=Bathymodiolus japonicus methanotrophic gill symbiont TaxID=113269 RepID=UPI001B527707|nr:ParA family protein [Bathymodiolus japonicus methanotrophic gill symbiont]GFO73022.1 chromosome partitioning protein [Bathymodiolus japonicus methanotrophic gill symbiont]
MTTIVFASSKGGAGKTTAAVVLTGELARLGASKNIKVTLIDADPNQHSAEWALKDGCPANIALKSSDEDTLLDDIEQAQEQSGFVVVDLEGTANISVTHAIHCADLVVLPCQGSHYDAKEVVKTIKLIRSQSKIARRNIPFSILMTRTNPAIQPRGLKDILSKFDQAGFDIFKCSLIEREAFRAIISFGGIVNDLDKKQVSGIEKAAQNAFAYAHEVINKIKGYNQDEEKRSAKHG